MAVGNVEKRGENKYRLTVSGGYDHKGKRIKHRKTITAKSDKEASKQLAIFIAEIERGNYVDPTGCTFADFVKRWRTDYAQTNLEAKTLYRYEYHLKDNILPVIGHLKLDQIKPLHLLDLYKRMAQDGARKDGKKGGYSTKTIRHTHTLIRSIFEKAVKWQLLAQNPAARVEPPKVKEKEINFYDAEQTIALINLLQKEPIKYRTMVLMAIFTGMRRGEVVGLNWDDIDFDQKVLHVKRSSVYIPGQGIITKSTKTVKSERVISISETLSVALMEYRAWQEEQINSYGDLWVDTGRVFTQEHGEPIHPDTISQWFIKFIKRHGLPPITLHGCRHTSATLLLSTGTDVETVSRILGHATSSTTSKVYLHSTLKARSDAMDRLDERLRDK